MTTGVHPDTETLFNEWYEQSGDMMLAVDEDAEDLLQEIYTRICENFEAFDPDIASFPTWANSVAANVLNDQFDYHNASKRTGSIEEYEDAYGYPAPPPELDQAVREKYNLTLKYIDSLKGHDKNVMQMYGEGYRHKEIAAALNLTKSQVNYSIRHSKKLIREMAANDEDWDYGEVAVAL